VNWPWLSCRFFSDDDTYGEIETGDTPLSFASHTLASQFIPGGYRRNDPAEQPAGVEIGFVTDDLGCRACRRSDEGCSTRDEAVGADRRLCPRSGRMLVEIRTPVSV